MRTVPEIRSTHVPTERILGYSVTRTGVDACVDSIVASISSSRECRWLACMNPHSYYVALDQPRFREALLDADWLIPDGAGIVLASLLLSGAVRTRVTGSDIFWRLNEQLERRTGASVFLLGSTEETLVAVRERMQRDFPRLRVAGTFAPPFRASFTAEEDDAMISAVNRARPDVLWVGMTAPKQELWIHAHRHRLEARFAGAVGAVFDFYSGRVKRSHRSFQQLGLEWLPRLLRQPRRLWRRTFVSAPRFFLDVVRSAVRRETDGRP